MPDFYDMHVALCREKRTPKRTPLRDASSPTATLPPLTLGLPSDYLQARRESGLMRLPIRDILSVKPQ